MWGLRGGERGGGSVARAVLGGLEGCLMLAIGWLGHGGGTAGGGTAGRDGGFEWLVARRMT